MKKAVALLAVLVLLCGLVLPSDAWAGGRGGWHHGGWHHGGGCCRGWGWFWPGAVVGGLVAGAVVAATVPFAYAAPPPVVYQPAPVYAQPGPAYTAPVAYAPSPSVQREVVYPNGKYVLYGDGVSHPWQWIWVPAASAPPPPPPPR